MSLNFKLNAFFIYLCYNKNQRGWGLGQSHAELEKASDRTHAVSFDLFKGDIEGISSSLTFSFFIPNGGIYGFSKNKKTEKWLIK